MVRFREDEAIAELLRSSLLYGLLFPGLLSALVLLLARLLVLRDSRGEAGSWGGGAAVGAGYLVGQAGIDGLPPFPPREATDWLWYLTFPALLLGLLDGRQTCPPWLRWALRAALWLALVWVVLPPEIRGRTNGDTLVAWLAGLGTGGLLFWGVLRVAARSLPGAALALMWLVVAVGSSVVLFEGHSARLAQLAAALAAALVPVLARSVRRPPLDLAPPVLVILLPGLWLTGYFYADASAPKLLLLATVLVIGAIGYLPDIWQSKPSSAG